MTRIALINPQVESAAKPVLQQISKAFGSAPNMFKAVANSPAALSSMWGSFSALSSGKLGAAIGEQVAVAIANRNTCHYCLAAHTILGQKAGLTAAQMAEAQVGRSSDKKTAAALKFALKMVSDRGAVEEGDVESLRNAGFDDEQIVELIAHVALNLFTNYINVALAVPVDFPPVDLKPVA